ncbi:VOC family protein [Limimaricola soesokkakensis]|uniref:VOC family protein n=1 Tax=Limimaricola soesokkakensis TaxID=1343159 RepID=UPI0035177892
MNVSVIYLSINAANFDAQSDWWIRLVGRHWDREPMPSCREWDLRDGVLLQVLDSPEGAGSTTVTLHVADLEAERARLAKLRIEVPQPVRIEGFETLRYAEISDPEGNQVGFLDGH